jgi:hypothetical protein
MVGPTCWTRSSPRLLQQSNSLPHFIFLSCGVLFLRRRQVACAAADPLCEGSDCLRRQTPTRGAAAVAPSAASPGEGAQQRDPDTSSPTRKRPDGGGFPATVAPTKWGLLGYCSPSSSSSSLVQRRASPPFLSLGLVSHAPSLSHVLSVINPHRPHIQWFRAVRTIDRRWKGKWNEWVLVISTDFIVPYHVV